MKFYYTSIYGANPDVLLSLLQSYDPKVRFLSLNAKVNGLKWEFNWNYYDIKDLLNIISVRNEESHRSPGTLSVEISNKEKEFNTLRKEESLSPSEIQKRDELKQKISNLKNFKKWLDPLPFDEVSAAIKKLSDRIKDQLTY